VFEFVNDYVRPYMLNHLQYICGIQRVCDYLLGAFRRERAGGFGRANQCKKLLTDLV
jgi:hypothetical protein